MGLIALYQLARTADIGIDTAGSAFVIDRPTSGNGDIEFVGGRTVDVAATRNDRITVLAD